MAHATYIFPEQSPLIYCSYIIWYTIEFHHMCTRIQWSYMSMFTHNMAQPILSFCHISNNFTVDHSTVQYAKQLYYRHSCTYRGSGKLLSHIWQYSLVLSLYPHTAVLTLCTIFNFISGTPESRYQYRTTFWSILISKYTSAQHQRSDRKILTARALDREIFVQLYYHI